MSYPLEIINLEKTYKDKKAVNNISFKVNQNEIIGILGPNGCGKTTTIGMILGLLKPSKGKILINGIDKDNFLSRIAKTYLSLIGGKQFDIFCENSFRKILDRQSILITEVSSTKSLDSAFQKCHPHIPNLLVLLPPRLIHDTSL